MARRAVLLLLTVAVVAFVAWRQQDDGSVGRAAEGVPDGARPATVVRVVDGDTVHLGGQDGTKYIASGDEATVRLLEIDTPESVKPDAPVECYSKRASAALADLLPVGSTVRVLRDRELLDPFDRTLLYVWNEDGVFVNLRMVQDGFAKAVLFQPNDRYIGDMRRAEERARDDGAGLWGACKYFGQPA